ncbi:MAG: DUF922 domain-containing protein [Chloroflexi bacterium]|nr:DUF922 domain-containing protein [Chloroflexota bacterium]
MCEQCGSRCCQSEEERTHAPEATHAVINEEAAPEQIQRTMADMRHGSMEQRQTAVLQLQRQQGNQAVRRLLESAESSVPSGQVQRWAVNIPADTPCDQVADLITQTSPYSPNWARAHFEFPWSSDYVPRGTAPNYTLTPRNLNVRMRPNIDVPQWSPSDPATRTAWRTAMSNLNTHEGVHRQTATTWRDTIQTEMRAYRPSVTAADEQGAVDQGESVFQGKHDEQTALHQNAQDQVDANGAGCVAIINCPAPREEHSTSAEGEGVAE